ncbi:hypothetical protein BH09PSE4_BH09PSE4_09250 [soil metagenome]
MPRPFAVLSLAMLLLAGCDRRPDSGPVIVSAIGAAPRLSDPDRSGLDTPERMLIGATAQGLVRFDANGQIEPGLAERWIVIDGGTSYIFRLRDAEWSDGAPVTAGQVVAALRGAIATRSRNGLAPYLTAVDEIVEMTPEVIEVRLGRPRPDLLKLFAQPEMAIFAGKPLRGSGPFRIVTSGRDTMLLRPAVDPGPDPDGDRPKPSPEADVRLIGERAARAVARFVARDSDMVAGGTFDDWPIVAAAGLAPLNIRVEPAAGLFGLAIVSREGLLATAAARGAIAAAIDRTAIVGAFAPGWIEAEAILPEQLDSAAPPAPPIWSTLALARRRAAARTSIAAWRGANPGSPARLQIALPRGSGSRILFAYLSNALASVGIEAVRVGVDSDADLRLVDAVAPYDSARWYLNTACAMCGDEAKAALEAARTAPTLAERSARIAEADAALAKDVAFVPIARPLRWSLVALRLAEWQGNPRAWHPLNHLRSETK